jgi:hypothetical protein
MPPGDDRWSRGYPLWPTEPGRAVDHGVQRHIGEWTARRRLTIARRLTRPPGWCHRWSLEHCRPVVGPTDDIPRELIAVIPLGDLVVGRPRARPCRRVRCTRTPCAGPAPPGRRRASSASSGSTAPAPLVVRFYVPGLGVPGGLRVLLNLPDGERRLGRDRLPVDSTGWTVRSEPPSSLPRRATFAPG